MQAETIKQTALSLFQKLSYSKTTVADIATASGLAKGTIYQHFGGKDAILRALIADRLAELVTASQTCFAAKQLSFDEKLVYFVSVIVEQQFELKSLIFGSFENIDGKMLRVVFSHLEYCRSWFQNQLQAIAAESYGNLAQHDLSSKERLNNLVAEFLELLMGRMFLHYIEYEWEDMATLKRIMIDLAPRLYKGLMQSLFPVQPKQAALDKNTNNREVDNDKS